MLIEFVYWHVPQTHPFSQPPYVCIILKDDSFDRVVLLDLCGFD